MRCNKCNKEVCGVISGEFGYKQVCLSCYKELVKQRDLKSIEELESDEVIHSLNPEQIVKNFIKYFNEYQKNPSHKLYDILWRIRCWACHEDHTASCAIFEICEWQKFDFNIEEERWTNGRDKKKS